MGQPTFYQNKTEKDVFYLPISNMAFGIQGLKVGRRNKYLVENNLNLNVVAVSKKSYPNQQFQKESFIKGYASKFTEASESHSIKQFPLPL